MALGGGFARGIAHIGVLRVFEQNKIPISAIAAVSSGAIVAAAFASGSTADEIERSGALDQVRDVARWTLNLSRPGGQRSHDHVLTRLLKSDRFEDMKIPLAVVATDLAYGSRSRSAAKGTRCSDPRELRLPGTVLSAAE